MLNSANGPTSAAIVAIRDRVAFRAADPTKSGWPGRHTAAWDTALRTHRLVNSPGVAVVEMIAACATYADAHRSRYADPIGEDYVLGEAYAEIVAGIRKLLDGEIGSLDGGTLWEMTATLASVNAIDPETFDLGYAAKE